MSDTSKRTTTVVTTTWTIEWRDRTIRLVVVERDDAAGEGTAIQTVTSVYPAQSGSHSLVDKEMKMKASDELREMTVRCLEAFTADVDYLTRHISQRDEVLAIGTDPEEWWAGHGTIAEIFKAQSEAMQEMAIVGIEPEAYSEGSVGWAAVQPIFRLPDGTELPFRLTLVYHQEDGAWKIVQWHASLGVANEEAIGEELPT